jgi:hypothetical protein
MKKIQKKPDEYNTEKQYLEYFYPKSFPEIDLEQYDSFGLGAYLVAISLDKWKDLLVQK